MTLPSWGLALFNGSRILLPLFDEVFGIRGEWHPEDGDGHVWLSFSSSAPSLPRLARFDCDSLFGSREKPATFQIGLNTNTCHGHYWNSGNCPFFEATKPTIFWRSDPLQSSGRLGLGKGNYLFWCVHLNNYFWWAYQSMFSTFPELDSASEILWLVQESSRFIWLRIGRCGALLWLL